MRIWGISDLHLSFSTDKPMHVFGDHWIDHATKMATAWDAHDDKIYQREVERLRLSLEAGRKLAAGRPLWAAIHYPPFDKRQEGTAYSRLLEEYGVVVCVYGHLHGRRAHKTAFEGERNGVRYHLIACDHLQFSPVLLSPAAPALPSTPSL